jgi:YVTN family beta-propeller protein
MNAFKRAFGYLATFTLLAVLPVLVILAGCNSDSDGGGTTSHRVYVSNYLDETISVIDTETDDVIETIQLDHRAGYTAVLPAINRLFVTGVDTNDVTVISTRTNSIVETLHMPGRAGAIAADPETNRVFVVQYGSSPLSLPLGTHVWVFNGSTLHSPTTITVPAAESLQFAAVDAVHGLVYVTDAGDGVDEGVVHPIDADDYTVYSSITCGVSPCGVAVHPNGHLVYVTNLDGSVTGIDVSGETPVATSLTEGISDYPYAVAVDTSLGKALVVNTMDNSISFISTASGAVISPFDQIMGSSPVWVAVDSEHHKAYVANSESDDVSVVNTSTGGVRATVSVGSSPICVSVIE